jgi:hypothetical protein
MKLCILAQVDARMHLCMGAVTEVGVWLCCMQGSYRPNLVRGRVVGTVFRPDHYMVRLPTLKMSVQMWHGPFHLCRWRSQQS